METDGIEEAFEGQLRVAVTAAGQIGQTIARLRGEALRRAQAQSEQQARELQSRIEAERRAARVELANVHRTEWWDQATPEQIGRTYQIARAWQHEDPEAVRAEQRMRDELRSRYGVDPHDAGADVDQVQQLIRAEAERAERERMNAEGERVRAAEEEAEALRLIAYANQEEQLAAEARAAAAHEPDPEERARAEAEAAQREGAASDARADSGRAYDSAERREATAHSLDAKGIQSEVVAARMRADVAQGKPATEAVQGAGKSKAPKARKSRGRGAQVQRTGLDR